MPPSPENPRRKLAERGASWRTRRGRRGTAVGVYVYDLFQRQKPFNDQSETYLPTDEHREIEPVLFTVSSATSTDVEGAMANANIILLTVLHLIAIRSRPQALSCTRANVLILSSYHDTPLPHFSGALPSKVSPSDIWDYGP
jgi:hypothetical protein